MTSANTAALSSPAKPSSSMEATPDCLCAALRVRAYLRAHGLPHGPRTDVIVAETIAEAQAQQPEGALAVNLALTVLEQRLVNWLGRIVSTNDEDLRPLLVRGRVALALSAVASRWPEHFLGESNLPAEMVGAVKECTLSAGPAVRLTHMAVRDDLFASGEARARRLVPVRQP